MIKAVLATEPEELGSGTVGPTKGERMLEGSLLPATALSLVSLVPCIKGLPSRPGAASEETPRSPEANPSDSAMAVVPRAD